MDTPPIFISSPGDVAEERELDPGLAARLAQRGARPHVPAPTRWAAVAGLATLAVAASIMATAADDAGLDALEQAFALRQEALELTAKKEAVAAVAGPGLRSAVQSRPPSRLVVLDPGTAETRTSNRVSLVAPAGITPSTSTAAMSSLSRNRSGEIPMPLAESPTSCRASSRSSIARISAGMARLPVPFRPTTSP